jgi:hypothetical protein
MSGGATPGDRGAHSAPGEWCPLWSRQHQSGGCDLARQGSSGCAGAGAVERKANGRHDGEEGVRAARRSMVAERSHNDV